MLTYLQGNIRLDISMATHQLAQFCLDLRLSHEQATTSLGRYLAHTKDRGIVYKPGKSMGIECYIDADFAGGLNITTSAADNVMPCTGFVITYANCLIYWASCLQTEIFLSTAKADYIAISSALHKVIPLMTLMKELHTIFPVHINKQNFFCKVHEDNQSTIRMVKSDMFTPRTKHIAINTTIFAVM
jgi:hypothetical protein